MERAINSDLSLLDKWYDLNGLKRNNNIQNTKPLSWAKHKTNQHLGVKNTIIPINFHLEMLGVNIDEQLKFNNHVSKVTRKVSQQIAVLREKMLPFKVRM